MAIDESKYTSAQKIGFNLLSLLTLLLLAPYINRFTPPLVANGWHIDLLAAVVVSFLIVYLLRWIFRPLILPVVLLMTGVLLINKFTDRYTFSNVLNDYKGMVQGNLRAKDSKQLDILSLYPRRVESYRDKTVRGMREKINSQDSVVRNFSVKHSLDYYDEYFYKYGKITRFLSLFRYINGHFKYVLDSRRDEYFATPQETIQNGLGGDCDDHSILMMSCLQSIGARCRIVLVKGHAYPELYCGDKNDFEITKQAIITLFPKPAVKEIYYHELKGEYWINLDYTARHPGGPYMNDKVYALIEL
ncbi:transglutaminase domain-containing protein [Chitinophaga polysaccharea]|uniref:transglutaminase domain-containing protein n=1 Tax=Chitinophaga TaxID=79328 RepID=UPI0014554282|nr:MULTISPECIES: transglutaminase domain-containing protein [Chitinophaga]NLR59650.1 transglutaminase domain-containing protein [Chitinophaga polysaccharea]NLU94003.1 transglutaminase domain-containing protein [Chitinophaga sp. Ak27]